MKPLEVLLVEDSIGDADLIRQALDELSRPVNLHIARDGAQALLMLVRDRLQPDLVIADLNLPELSGYEVITRVHQMDVPVVVFSSSWYEADERRAVALGARQFVRKPSSLDSYKSAVRKMIESWAERSPGDHAARLV